MAYPTTKVEIAFAGNWYDTSPTWVDVTTDVRQITTSRGRTQDLQPFDAGTAQIVLDNRTRKYDPLNTAGPYYGNLRPRRQIRITADPGTGIGFQAVYRGFTGGFPTTWTEAGYDSTVTVECFDLLALISDQRLPNDWSANSLPGFRFLMDDPETTNILTSSATGWTATQVVGGVPFRKTDPIAPGVDRQAIYIGEGNTYRTNQFPYGDITPPANNVGNFSAGFWWAPNAPDTLSSPVNIEIAPWNLQFFCQADNKLRVDVYTNGTLYRCISTTSPLKSFGSHHLAATWQPLSNTIKVYIDGNDVSGATTSTAGGTTNTKILEVQFTQDIIQDFFVQRPNNTSVLSAAQINEIYEYGIGQFPETTAARLDRYLNAVTSPSTPVPNAWRSFTTAPDAQVAELIQATGIVDGINQTVDSEGGEFFVNKAGVMVFKNRYAAVTTASSTPAATFNDTGTGLTYGPDLTIQIDDRNIRNDLTVTFTAGGNIRTTNADSISTNGTVAGSISTSLSTVAQAQNLADFRRSIDAKVQPQLSAIDVSTNTSNSAWATILGLELIDSGIQVNRTPSTGSAITQKLVLIQIEHTITPDRWETKLVGTARFNGWFVLDVSALDGPDLLLG